MKIGLDIDNVILDTDKKLLNEFLKEDKNKRNRGIINKDADYIMSGMFDWSKEEIEDFLINNMEKIAKKAKPVKDSKKYMRKLLREGYELYLISNRSYPYYKSAAKTTKENLKKNNIEYTKLILTDTNDKSRECKKFDIDIMFDDRASNCFKLLDKKIKCCLFRTIYEKRKFDNLDIVSNWEELYLKVKEVQNERI